MNADTDIAIAGGGMVGAALALLISRACATPPRITVIEPQACAAGGDSPSFDQRSTALSLSSVAVLEAAGLWPALHAKACAIDSIHVSDRGHFGSLLMQAADEDLAALGYVIENRALGQVLMAAQADWPGIRWQPARASAVQVGDAAVQLDCDDGTTCRARLLIVADGAQSVLRRQLGVQVQETDYRQTALIANIATEKPHRGRAFERFTDQGPLAMLPLPDAEGWQRSALVWTLPPAEAGRLCQADETEFLVALQARFGHRLGRLLKAGERAAYPLTRRFAAEQVRPRIVIAGNAAHALHPVAGQGFNLALRDAAVLAAELARNWQQGDPGALTGLQRYAALQQADQQRTADVSESITRLFSSRHPLLAGLRGAGLLLLDSLPGLKSAFVREATGIGRHHPQWKSRA